jgi:hypothetical protein
MKRLAAVVALLAALTAAVTATAPAKSALHHARATHAAVNPLVNIPVTGTAADGSTFKGTVSGVRFVADNGKAALEGVLNGTLTSSGGGTKAVTNQAVTLPLTATGTCKILHLNLGPLDLNLLGLQVHLDKVVLDITAQAGPGQLLGNLLCGVAHLLDRNGSLSSIVAGLNSILGLANLANGLPVAGTASDGSTLNGVFTPQRIIAKGRGLTVNGLLTGTLTDSSGHAQSVSKQVTLPLTASGTCNILHLRLGATTLNLLGLNVHLNTVVLNITAQRGPGNLLGNLLCSIAHLLDRNPPLTGAAAQLNKLLGP